MSASSAGLPSAKATTIGSPLANRRRASILALAISALALLAASPTAHAAAAPSELWTSCPSGSGAGQCQIPRGIATDPANGHLYIVDQQNNRIVELDAWGQFVKAWGWGVADHEAKLETCGPGASPPTATCLAGLQGAGAGQLSAPQGIATDTKGDVYVVDFSNHRVQKFDSEGHFLLAFGGDVAASGPGNTGGDEQQTLTVKATKGTFTLSPTTAIGSGAYTNGSKTVTGVSTTLGALHLGDAISALGVVPAGATIEALGPETLTLSAPATATNAGYELTAKETTGPIAFDAKANEAEGAGSVEAALDALPGVGPGAIAVSGGPGDATGSAPYTVTFSGGAFKGNDVAQISASNAGLSEGAKEATVATTVPGGGPEVCRAAEHDVCKAGTEGTANGQFGSWPFSSFIAVGPADQVYVGDNNRIQRFNTEGEYQAQIPLPEAGEVGSLAVDPGTGDLYFGYAQPQLVSKEGIPNVYKLDPATGAVLTTLEVDKPAALAADAEGNVYVSDARLDFHEKANHPARVYEFNSAGAQTATFAEGEFEDSTGIAAGSACLSAGADLYLSNTSFEKSFIRAYGPSPDKPACPPPPAAPSIDAQYALSVGSGEALLKAQVNPHFWSGAVGETDYFVQYGTAECIEAGGWGAGCVKGSSPAKLISGAVKQAVATAGVFLPGLSPGTEYSYRFLAESKDLEGNPVVAEQPVAGVGGEPGKDGKAAAFSTFSEPAEPNTECENQALRGGPAATLPDCRAYEMVSPVDKEGGDIATRLATKGPSNLDQSATSGEALTYSSYRAFGEPASAPFSSQYIARRGSGGWASEAISPPQEGEALLEFLLQINNQYRIFSPDLSEAWLVTYTEPVLAPGEAPPGFANFYRRDDASGEYEACTTAAQEEPGSGVHYVGPKPLGVSGDGRHGLFRIEAKMTPDAAPGSSKDQLYECSYAAGEARKLRLVSVLPDGTASALSNTAGTAINEGWGFDLGRAGSYAGAISGDGSRVYWTATADEGGPGTLYLRLHPDQEESARLNGAASGTGDLIATATATGTTVNGSATVGKVEAKSGEFAAGQQISDSNGGIPAGTTIQACSPSCAAPASLTLSAKATKTKAGDELTGAASALITNLITESGAFQTGQQISGPAIPAGTTVAACSPSCGPAATSLTLSAKATETEAAAALAATSECTEAAKACTIAVSETVTQGAAEFLAANPSGSEALFRDKASEGLYEFDATTETPTLIAPKAQGVVGHSEDLSRVYLVSREACSENANGVGEEAKAGEPNLYLYEAGEECAAGELTFVATLADGGKVQGATPSIVNQQPFYHTALASPDGSTLAFMSNDPALAEAVAGYDNTDQAGGKADAEVYRYEAATGKLACLSCNRGGARPRGRTATGGLTWAAAKLPTWETSLYATRSLSEDGRRVFFESYEPLLLADTNGAADVYQWEQAGAGGPGGCEEAGAAYLKASGGCLSLISSGKSPDDTEFVDASPDGRDVFIRTSQSLLPSDPGSIDIYDARALGGFPAPQEPPAACEGEACQSPPEAPNDPSPASASFEGAGNVVEAAVKPEPCRKGKVKRKGRCVVAKKHHGKAHRKSDRADHKSHVNASNRGGRR